MKALGAGKSKLEHKNSGEYYCEKTTEYMKNN